MHRQTRESTEDFREMQASALHEAPKAVSRNSRIARIAGLNLALGAFFAYLGPFGTEDFALWRRLGFWVLTIALGMAVGWSLALGLERFKPLAPRPILRTFAAALLMTPIYTLVVWGAIRLFFGAIPLSGLPSLALSVLILSCAFAMLGYLLERAFAPPAPADAAKPAPADEAKPAPGARFSARLPARLRMGVLYALEAQDHYLKIHTSLGEDLILLRLSDAIAELEGVEGRQTHRSWWVAKAAISSVERVDGRIALVLANGLRAPVSRTYAPVLKAENWI